MPLVVIEEWHAHDSTAQQEFSEKISTGQGMKAPRNIPSDH